MEIIENFENHTDDRLKFSNLIKTEYKLDDYTHFQNYFSLENLISQFLSSEIPIKDPALFIQSIYKPTSNSYIEAIVDKFVTEILHTTSDKVEIKYILGSNPDLEVIFTMNLFLTHFSIGMCHISRWKRKIQSCSCLRIEKYPEYCQKY